MSGDEKHARNEASGTLNRDPLPPSQKAAQSCLKAVIVAMIGSALSFVGLMWVVIAVDPLSDEVEDLERERMWDEERALRSQNHLALAFYESLGRREGSFLFSPIVAWASIAGVGERASGSTRQQFQHVLGRLDKWVTLSDIELDHDDFLSGRDPAANIHTFAIDNYVFPRRGGWGRPAARRGEEEKLRAVWEERTESIETWVARPAVPKWNVDRPVASQGWYVMGGCGNDRTAAKQAAFYTGAWYCGFVADKTTNEAFFLEDGTSVMVPMMRGTGYGEYRADAEAEVVALAFRRYTGGRGNERMLIVLPARGRSLADLESHLTPGFLEGLVGWESRPFGSVCMPKFSLRSQLRMRELLEALGIDRAFDPAKAEFGKGENAEGLYCEEIGHMAQINVNENGMTELAETRPCNPSRRPKHRSVRVDRPFLFFVMDGEIIILMGRVLNPLDS